MTLLHRAQDQVMPDSTERDPMERLKALQEVLVLSSCRRPFVKPPVCSSRLQTPLPLT